ncbi:MAG: SpvB/TcaC N-terminal domain-containing protein, partial [Myxococcota bacterium]
MDYFKMRRVQCACLLSLVLCLLYSAAPVIGDTGGVEQASSEEGFSFSESSPALSDTLTAQGQSNAAKHWTAPVTRTGDYTRAYTIDLPPGRAGMTPTLGLGYQSSNRSESTAGVGWSLPRRSIRRSTSNGVPPVHRVGGEPKYDDSTTVFEIDGQVLVPLDDTEAQPFPTTSSSRFFGLQREGSVVRYEYTGLESKDCWIAHLPDGSKELYGCDTAHDRHGRVVNVQGTFEWLLLEIRDSSGNTIVYDYHFLDDP